MTELDNEIQSYVDTESVSTDEVKGIVKEFQKNKTFEFPVCILSHKFDKRRSKFLAKLELEIQNNNLSNHYYIFTYEDQKDLYRKFEAIHSKVHVIYVPLDKKYSTLTGKRQYILDWNIKEKHSNAFFIEDDCFDFCLPVGKINPNTGNYKNYQFVMSFDFVFGFWECLVNKYDLKYSGPVNNMDFAFRDLRTTPFIKKYAQAIQAVHINIDSCKALNLFYDENSGWDDYDMILQQCIYNTGSAGIGFSYNTPSLKSGVSAMSASIDALKERCIKNTTLLMNKWGSDLVRIDDKKGLYNAKVKWTTIKKAVADKVPLKSLIHKTIPNIPTLEDFYE